MRVQFGQSEGKSLSGVLEAPIGGQARGFAIFCHCFSCTSQIKAAVTISRALARQGIGVLRFDFTGLGKSEGDFESSTFSGNLEDVELAAQFLEENYSAPSLLIGHSLGGAAALYAAPRIASIQGVVTIGAPADPEHVLHLLDQEGRLKLPGVNLQMQEPFIDDLKQGWSLQGFDKALLVCHAPQDNIVGIENAQEIFQAVKHPKSFISLDTADHLLTNAADAEYVAQVVSGWAGRYLPQEALSEHPNEVVAQTGQEGFLTELKLRAHALLADEPVSVGGSDAGPSPYDLLAMALGSCTTMTLQMYAKRKKWPLEIAKIRVDHTKIHAEDCAECETQTGKLDRFTRELTLVGDLSEEQRSRLKEIADKCPVHRTLHSEVVIQTCLLP